MPFLIERSYSFLLLQYGKDTIFIGFVFRTLPEEQRLVVVMIDLSVVRSAFFICFDSRIVRIPCTFASSHCLVSA